jgi:hypothetical protein
VASKGFRSAVARRGAALAGAALIVTAVVGSLVLRAPARATASGTQGYWLASTDGGVFNYGQAPFFGSAGSAPLNSPIVGFVPTPTAGGYWMVASDGGIFAFGDAGFFGSMGGKPLNRPIAAMAAAPNGRGYWMVASDGGVFAFGDAPFFGSLAGERLTKPIVDFAVTPTGRGYWMATSDGLVYGFGDAGYYGSVESGDLNKRIQGLAPTPTGHGYWLAAADGAVFHFGDAADLGSAVGKTDKRVVDMAATPTGKGYYLVTSNGQVFPFGDATAYGDATKTNLNDRVTAIATLGPTAPGAGNGAAPGAGNGPGPGAGDGAPSALKAVDDAVDGKEDSPLTIDVLANDKAPPGDGPLTLQTVSPPQHGQAHVADNRVAYQPTPCYHGADTFTYTVSDPRGGSSTATVHVTLATVNHKPEAVDDAATITDGGPITIDVTANDRGLCDGVKSVAVTRNPAHGSATVGPDQKVGYTPTSGFNGTDTFEYRVTDTDGESSTAKVTVTVGGAGAHGPVAVDDSLTTRSGRQTPIDVVANDDVPGGAKEVRFADANGAPTDATEIGTAAGGMARRSGTRISYTAPSGTFTGSDSFTYVVLDNSGNVSKPATVRATVVTNKPPQVKDGTVAVPQNRQAAGSIAKLGWDPEKDAITFALRSSPAGQLTLRPDGSFLYQAPAGVDVDAFSFVANDGNSDSNEGHLSIQITQAQAASASSTSTTTPTTTKSSTTPPSTTTTAKSSTSTTTSPKSSTGTTPTTRGKGKKPASSNNRGKPTTSTSAKSKAVLVPVLPLAAAPALSRRRRRARRRAGR